MKKITHAPRKRLRTKALATSGKRRRAPRKKGILSDMFNPTIAMNSAKNTLLSAGGGLGAMIVNKTILPATATKGVKTAVAIGVGFLASSFGMEKLGSGFTGGLIALTFQNGLMADDTDFAEESVLSEYPPVLDEYGNAVILEENDGEAYYRPLNDAERDFYNV
jgi:hypothetical protein